MIEISKELLCKVLENDICKYTIVSTAKTTQIRAWKKDAEMWDYRSYDIHYLAHKCKEWAFSKKYELVSYPSILWKDYQCIAIDRDGNRTEPFREDNEVQAIIKACEWLLKEINK